MTTPSHGQQRDRLGLGLAIDEAREVMSPVVAERRARSLAPVLHPYHRRGPWPEIGRVSGLPSRDACLRLIPSFVICLLDVRGDRVLRRPFAASVPKRTGRTRADGRHLGPSTLLPLGLNYISA